MTPEQEHDINNALLTLMYEWKLGTIDQRQALKEFKQCLKYYSRMEDVIRFEQSEMVDNRIIEHYGLEETIRRNKEVMVEKIAHEALKKGCVSFEEVEHARPPEYPPIDASIFRMKMEAIIEIKPQ